MLRGVEVFTDSDVTKKKKSALITTDVYRRLDAIVHSLFKQLVSAAMSVLALHDGWWL